MAEHKPLYVYSLSQAVRSSEKDLWRESYKENCDCARAIERAINENYCDNVLNDCTHPIIDNYGFNRVNWVLADTVRQNKGGFGCYPNSRGRKVFGQFLKDGEDTHFYREDFIGAIDEKYLPDWAREKIVLLSNAEDQDNEKAPSEDCGMTVGGI